MASKRSAARLHPTRNDLPEGVRVEVVLLLNALLADALDLGSQAKQAHWNVKGPQFLMLHELFDRVASTASEHADTLAERAAQLGGTALGTVRVASATSRLPEYPLDIAQGREHVDALSRAVAAYAASARAAIDVAAKLGDAGTADLFTELSREADLQLWFLEAHLQGA